MSVVSLQEDISVAYLGPAGSYTHEVCSLTGLFHMILPVVNEIPMRLRIIL